MISTHWLTRRTPHWRRLESLIEKAVRGGIRDLATDELSELALLYRQVASDLATVREDAASTRYAEYLNQLLARAHNTIYAAERPTSRGLWPFLRDTFPRAFRRLAIHVVVACALFLLGAGVGAVLTARDPDFALKVIGPEMVATINRHEMWTHSIVTIKPYASSAIMTNNITVSFAAFATGIAAGLGTIYMMAVNGLLIGVVGVACAGAGLSLPLWSFVAPHGVLELPAIFIAGGAGLRLGQGLVFPGYLTRRTALIAAGRDAIPLVLGCVPLLIVAGVIEAFVSPTGLPLPLKFGTAAALFAMLVAYLGTGWRPAATTDPEL